jgi:hypothetical protein
MQKHEALTRARELLTELLRPTAIANAVSLKAMPDDMSAGVIRSAMWVPFAQQVSTESSTTSARVADKQTGMLTVSCYVLVLAASQVGPRGAEWACGLASDALDGVRTGHGTAWPELAPSQVFVKSTDFTSYKDQIWQYRVQVDLQLPYSSDNLAAKQDIALLDRLNSVTW